MRKGIAGNWRALGRVGQAFVLATVLFSACYFLHARLLVQIATGTVWVLLGLAVAYKVASSIARRAIWRLRNRLIVAYLFIAVVPIVLILSLADYAGEHIIGQVAVYLVDTELQRLEGTLTREMQSLTGGGRGFGRGGPGLGGPGRGIPGRGAPGRGVPGRGVPGRGVPGPGIPGSGVPGRGGPGANPPDSQAVLNLFMQFRSSAFPAIEIVVTGTQQARYPVDSKLEFPVGWEAKGDQHVSGLVVRQDGNQAHLYIWALESHNGIRALAMLPVTHELLAGLVKGLGDVNYMPLMGHIQKSNLPPAANIFDFRVSGLIIGLNVPSWESAYPEDSVNLTLTVDTRLSRVLGILFGQKLTGPGGIPWSEMALGFFLAISTVFLLLELISLVAGIQLSRSITGAVHEMYEGTQHVKAGDFAYRVPVKGHDQLADLTTSFNSMTENLGRLVVVAKEKERLESELTIAREVQDQLFPKDVPFTKTLELKGVCQPARMVSGDYYDFMALPHDSLAFAIGDVAGKGISAALLMATIQSTMRTQIGMAIGNGNGDYRNPSTARMVATLNRQLYATTAPEKYATFYFAIYDEAQHALTYTNAGHLSPMLVRHGNVSLLEPTGTVVGAFPIATYEEKTVKLEHGDMLVAYTDGLVEPENAYGEMYGEERLQDLLIKYASADSSEIIARAMEAVVQWTGSSELQDDMTMVVARRI